VTEHIAQQSAAALSAAVSSVANSAAADQQWLWSLESAVAVARLVNLTTGACLVVVQQYFAAIRAQLNQFRQHDVAQPPLTTSWSLLSLPGNCCGCCSDGAGDDARALTGATAAFTPCSTTFGEWLDAAGSSLERGLVVRGRLLVLSAASVTNNDVAAVEDFCDGGSNSNFVNYI